MQPAAEVLTQKHELDCLKLGGASPRQFRVHKVSNSRLHKVQSEFYFVVLCCNFRSLAFLGLLGFLKRQLNNKFIATLLSAHKFKSTPKP